MLTEVRSTRSPAPVDDGHEPPPRAHRPRTEPAAVPSPSVDRSVERTAEQRIGRAAVVGCVIGIALMVPAFFVVGIATGAGTAGAVGIALFCSFWGGLGLGGMWGAVAAFGQEERREAEAARALRLRSRVDDA